MPLLTSPIDGSPMRQINRYGIELDVCPTTGGVWLDKGELEKLMALMKDAVNDDESDFQQFKKAKASNQLPPDYYEQPDPRMAQKQYYEPSYKKYDRDDDYDDYNKYKYKKKSKLKSIMDIFD